jgi:hypothetical protein
MTSYGDTQPASALELDHLAPLELGGDPWAVTNLWPEPDFHLKDKVENAAHKAVCSHSMTLVDAQHEITTNWVELGRQLGVA